MTKLSNLPPDALREVLRRLPVRNVARLGATSKALRPAAAEELRRGRRVPPSRPSYALGTGKHQRLFNVLRHRVREFVTPIAASIRMPRWGQTEVRARVDLYEIVKWLARLMDALRNWTIAYEESRVRRRWSGKRAYWPTPWQRTWDRYQQWLPGMASRRPPKSASWDLATDRFLEFAQAEFERQKRRYKRILARDARLGRRGVDGHVPLHKLMAGLRI